MASKMKRLPYYIVAGVVLIGYPLAVTARLPSLVSGADRQAQLHVY